MVATFTPSEPSGPDRDSLRRVSRDDPGGELAGSEARMAGMVKRRGLLAGAAALMAGGLAQLAGSGRAEAAHDTDIAYNSQTVLHADQINTTTGRTTISAPGSFTPLVVQNGSTDTPVGPSAIFGATSHANSGGSQGGGIQGLDTGDRGIGAIGTAEATNGIGVYGAAARKFVTEGGNPGTGVFGFGPTYGLAGRTPDGTGAFGTSTTGTGVRGDSRDGNGVFGLSTNATGVYGFSGNSYGAAGISRSYTGVYAHSDAHWGLHAESGASFAAVFSGPIFINGSYTATGAKSAAVKNRRGEHRRMYCQESPEPWFEDFGRGELRNGRAEVALDPEFDEVVKGDDYLVFLTEVGDLGGLYVSKQGPHRFEVRSRNATSEGAFNYRVVARRLDDVGRRLEKVDVPDFSKVKRLSPPDLPTGTGRPDRPGR